MSSLLTKLEKLLRKPGKIISLVFWTAYGLYIGIGGLSRLEFEERQKSVQQREYEQPSDSAMTWTYRDPVTEKYVSFATYEDLAAFAAIKSLSAWFPWLFGIPSFLALVLAATAFGALGGVTGLAYQLAVPDPTTTRWDLQYFYLPFMGFLIGLLVLGIANIFPALLTVESGRIRPMTLTFLCLFCGLFSSKFYGWMSGIFDNFFKGEA